LKKSVTKVQDLLKLDKNDFTFMIISRSILLKIRHFPEKIVEKIKTHILCSITSLENRPIMRKCKKIFRFGQATDDNILVFHCKNGCTSTPQFTLYSWAFFANLSRNL